ncbi:hypothetical protein K502DRAFT_323932 [Neoconidiobolus thromboides FSU 785]|nr:hypothetical protein K502DRAFT_323932 [Neoconidiobolus thromboides FSU 785]
MKEPEETREIKQEIEGLMTITKEYMKISALIKQGVNINSSISNLLNPMYYGRESFEQDSKIMRKTIEDYKTVDERLRNEMIAHQNSKMEYKKFKKRSDLYFKSIDSIEAHSNNNKLDFGLSGLHKTLMKYYNGIEMVNGSELPSYTTDQPIQESTFSLKNQQFLEEIKYQERYIPF